MNIPFWILKKIIVIRETKYKYCIDTDGCGLAWIDEYVVSFTVNKYDEILVGTIRCNMA